MAAPLPGLTAIVERGALVQALATLLKVIEPKPLVPVYTHVFVEAEADVLVLTGTGYDLQATVRVPHEIARPGTATIPAQELHDFAASFAAGAKIQIGHDASKLASAIRCGASRLRLPGFSPDIFAKLGEAGAFGHSLTITGSTLAKMLARTKFATGTDDTRHFLMGVFAHVVEGAEGPALRFVASDGARLAQIESGAPEGIDPAMPGIIIPRKACDTLQMLGERAADGAVVLDVSKALLRIRHEATVLVSKLVDGIYPEYERIIPRENPHRATMPAAALTAAVKRVARTSDDKHKQIRFALAPGQLSITARNGDGADAEDQIEVEYDGPELSLSLSARFLNEIVSAIGGETLLGQFSEAPGALHAFTHRDGADALYVLAPMRG